MPCSQDATLNLLEYMMVVLKHTRQQLNSFKHLFHTSCVQINEARMAAREAEVNLKRAESKIKTVEIKVKDLTTAEDQLKRELEQEKHRRSSFGGSVGGCFGCGTHTEPRM